MEPVKALASPESRRGVVFKQGVVQVKMIRCSPHVGHPVCFKLNLLKDGVAEPPVHCTSNNCQVESDVLVRRHNGGSRGGELKLVDVGFSSTQTVYCDRPFLLIRIVKDVTETSLDEGEVLEALPLLRASVKGTLVLEIGIHQAEVLAREDGRPPFAFVLQGQEDVSRVVDEIRVKRVDLEQRSNDTRGLEGLRGEFTEVAAVVGFEIANERLVRRDQGGEKSKGRV